MGKLYKALEKAEKERGGGQGIEVVREETSEQIPEQPPARPVAPVTMTLPGEVASPNRRYRSRDWSGPLHRIHESARRSRFPRIRL